MTRDIPDPCLLTLGHGYCAKALAARLVPAWRVVGSLRDERGCAGLRAAGVAPVLWENREAVEEAVDAATHVLVSVPPDAAGCPVLARHGAEMARGRRLAWLGYLSTTGVYGDCGGDWVDEDAPLRPASPRGAWRVAAEAGWLAWGEAEGVAVHVFRLAGIYGPGRSALDRLREGRAQRIVKAGQVFSRVHVADVAAVLAASMAAPDPGRVYNVADDEPAPPQDVVAHAAALLGVQPPPEVPFEKAELSPMARSFYGENKRVSNLRIKAELGVRLTHPTYRAGLAAILAAEALPARPAASLAVEAPPPRAAAAPRTGREGAAFAAAARRLALEAGAVILGLRGGGLGLRLKDDRSPVTEADERADRLIAEGLRAAFPAVPVVTEEQAATHRPGGSRFFLVDPLDGTGEFARGGDDFTVNIALVEDGVPVRGVVHAPAHGRLFYTDAGGEAVEEAGPFAPGQAGALRRLGAGPADPAALRIVASKSHRNAATDAYLSRYPGAAVRAAGSSLKFCLLACGEADLYPRLGRTMEWDTAAGQAILAAAGGRVLRLSDLTPLGYGKPGLENPSFVAHVPGAEPLAEAP